MDVKSSPCPICGSPISTTRRRSGDWVDCPEQHHSTTPRKVWQDALVAQLVQSVEAMLVEGRRSQAPDPKVQR
jgi:hypothetical protein